MPAPILTRDTLLAQHIKAEDGGPWHQAPPEFGGKWWWVQPLFGEQEPWKRQNPPPPPPQGPPMFIALFGPRPIGGASDIDYRIALADWENWLKDFVDDPNVPAWANLAPLHKVFEFWLMGIPVAWQSAQYGWLARFPALRLKVPQFPYYDAPLYLMISDPNVVVFQYQLRALENGIDPSNGDRGKRHPYVPPGMWAEIGQESGPAPTGHQ